MSAHTKKKSVETEGLTPFAEIGKRLGITENAAQLICWRAMKKLSAHVRRGTGL